MVFKHQWVAWKWNLWASPLQCLSRSWPKHTAIQKNQNVAQRKPKTQPLTSSKCNEHENIHHSILPTCMKKRRIGTKALLPRLENRDGDRDRDRNCPRHGENPRTTPNSAYLEDSFAVCLRSPLAPRLHLPGHRHAPPLPRKSSRNPLLHTPATPECNPRQPPISRGWTMRTQERGGLGFLAFQGCFPVLAVLLIY